MKIRLHFVRCTKMSSFCKRTYQHHGLTLIISSGNLLFYSSFLSSYKLVWGRTCFTISPRLMIIGMLVNHHNPVLILQKWGPLAEDCKSDVTKKSLNIYTPNPVIGVYPTDFKYQDLNWKMTFPWHVGKLFLFLPYPHSICSSGWRSHNNIW